MVRLVLVCLLAACSDSGSSTVDGAMTSDSPANDGAMMVDADPSCALGDDFAGSTLDPCWSVLNGGANPIVQIAQTGGALHLQAISGVDRRWYNGGTGALVYQTVMAWNFKVTTTVRPRKRTDATLRRRSTCTSVVSCCAIHRRRAARRRTT